MASIMQGTTPSLTIHINTDDFLISDVSRIELYISNGKDVATYTQDDLTIDTAENTITKKFSEEETAAMPRRGNIAVQGRFFFPDESIVGIQRITFSVSDMLGVGD